MVALFLTNIGYFTSKGSVCCLVGWQAELEVTDNVFELAANLRTFWPKTRWTLRCAPLYVSYSVSWHRSWTYNTHRSTECIIKHNNDVFVSASQVRFRYTKHSCVFLSWRLLECHTRGSRVSVRNCSYTHCFYTDSLRYVRARLNRVHSLHKDTRF